MDLYLEDSKMDVLNLGKMKKKKGITATPKVASAQNAIVNHSSTIGKSRVQGNEGAMQGNEGWKSQYTDAGAGYSKQINPIINSLSQAPTYDAPKIEHKLTSLEGFNEALNVITARNNAKLRMQNQRVLQGVLGSLVSGDSQNRATASRVGIAGMNDATKRRGQDLKNSQFVDSLEETKNRNDTLADYYEGQTAIGEERNRIADYKAKNPVGKTLNPIDVRLKRQKLMNSGEAQVFGAGYNDADSDTQKAIQHRFLETGEKPIKYNKEHNGLFSNKYTPVYASEQKNNAPQATTQTSQQPKQEAFKLDGKQINLALHAYADDQGYSLSDLHEKNGQIVTPDGVVPLKAVWERINNGNVR